LHKGWRISGAACGKWWMQKRKRTNADKMPRRADQKPLRQYKATETSGKKMPADCNQPAGNDGRERFAPFGSLVFRYGQKNRGRE
jgi:hypothetical protein